ncbi:symmetrical bis(5'-nucleosyl)-tetraphosphatase [Hydrogenovibrio thermophilus]|uniref:bis(5'-nucleosyl)-tetraphosphatase (symmetrical) n=1 Tax=Hydrogenovibrio thermophilus TaxID=265883 RepID=A0A410H4A2_9GAMM|nr:symmetrical bis(5'-nucleosyl)-tetraphosphatase [Hydrogenovibrio thermophilus]QAB15762.1 symmetrical bis(5'-nucleosyl)-tetraphosphatase [Hydrogenovibrio thermophilus]
MATYVIGDLQGCFDELLELLAAIEYDEQHDVLWFAGDIVNRGPKSLECLTFVKSIEESGRGKTVLGNHDFHLLAAYSGLEKYVSKSDTLTEILQSEDAPELLDWLRRQPLVVKHDYLPVAMVHAGIPPQWTIAEALTHSREVEQHLQSDAWQTFIREHLFGSEPREWQETLTGWERIRYIVNAFARMRYCDDKGKLEFKQKMSPNQADSLKKHYQPWFAHGNRKNKDHEIFFGHWSTLGAVDAYNIHSTDTGCLWGGELTAYCLETHTRHTIKCKMQCKPKKKP